MDRLVIGDACRVAVSSLASSYLDPVNGRADVPHRGYPLWARWHDELDQCQLVEVEQKVMLLGGIPVRETLDACWPNAALTRSRSGALDRVRRLAAANGADRQRAFVAGNGRLDQLVASLAGSFFAPDWLAATAGRST